MVDTKLTAHLADLSKISFTSEELTRMTAQMQDIIALMDKIGSYSADNKQPSDNSCSFSNLRPDCSRESFQRDVIMKNATEKQDGYFSVMKVVE